MGRAPTSGYCHTCRLRRIKCDRARPSCDRCLKSGYECKGYEVVLRMQSHGVVAGAEPGTSRLAKVGKTTSFPVSASTAASCVPTTAGRRGRRGQKLLTPSSPSASSSTSSRSGSSAEERSPSAPPELSLTPFVDEIAFSYFFESYGWINMHSLLLQDAPLRDSLSQKADALGYDSLRALSYGLFARDHHVDSLQRYATRLYGASLELLRSKLSSPSKTELASLTKPIAILGSYSVAVERDLRFTHHRGLVRILEHCGPESFQSPELLTLFESCRATLIASSMVRRQATFLAHEPWISVPWDRAPESRTSSSKLLNLMARVPALLEAVFRIMEDRRAWLASGGSYRRRETPSWVPDLQREVDKLKDDLARWHTQWLFDNVESAADILTWAFRTGGNDTYRAGIFGAYGPDVYGLSMDLSTTFESPISRFGQPPFEPRADPAIFQLMQDASLYTTVLVWADRLHKYLARAAQTSMTVDFFNAPFFTACDCCALTCSQTLCEAFPSPSDTVENTMAWNVNTARMAESPVRILGPAILDDDMQWTPGVVEDDPGIASVVADRTPYSITKHQVGRMLLPGDHRFSAQLRILKWLVEQLPSSRSYVLGTLAAMGMGHCAHDVRPTEGMTSIANAAQKIVKQTGFEGAVDLFLKSYR